MKEFFKQCLKDLESLTGLRQLYFLQTDEDGERKVDVVITGMILAAADYPYIPQEAQQKIIREQMVKDQTYEALNSRVVHKWLTLAAGKYYRESSHQETQGKAVPPAPPEVAQKYTQQLLASLSEVGREVPQLTPAQILAEGQPVKDPAVRGSVASGWPSLSAEEVHKRRLHLEYIRANYHPITQEKLPGWMEEEEWIKQQTPTTWPAKKRKSKSSTGTLAK